MSSYGNNIAYVMNRIREIKAYLRRYPNLRYTNTEDFKAQMRYLRKFQKMERDFLSQDAPPRPLPKRYPNQLTLTL
jgi:hypothetical protein